MKRLAGKFIREKKEPYAISSISHVKIVCLLSSPKSRKLERLEKLP